MQFSRNTERWRPIVEKYLRPEDVDKMLWVIDHESSGDPNAVGDGGSSVGLTQLNKDGLGAGMSSEQRKDPEANIRKASEAIYGGQGWRPWGGEGNTFNGKPFGALGNNPFPGDQEGNVKGQQEGNGFSRPVYSGKITQVFGPTSEPLDSGGVNKGLDISVPTGTAVSSVTQGTVINAGDAGDGWGTSVKVQDAQGNIHNYGHLSGANVSVGDTVSSGQVLGKSGNSGASTGPHLSYDVKGKDGQYVDPSPWLGFNAAGDNRQGHDAIGKDIGDVAPEIGAPQTGTATSSPGGGAAANTPLTDEDGNTMYYTDPEVNDQFIQLRDRANSAMQAWIDSGQQAYSDEYYAMTEAMDAMDQFQVVYQQFSVEPENGEDPAQQAFDNSIRLGDLNLREADSAFNKWLNKTESARAAAVNERDQRAGYNESLAERTEARDQASTPGLMPRARNAGYVEQSFEDMLGSWQEKFGVEDQFDPDDVDYTTPEEVPDQGTTAPPDTGTGAPQVAPDDTTHSPPVGHPAGTPRTVGHEGNVPPKGHPASTEPTTTSPHSPTTSTPPSGHPAMAGPSQPEDTPWWRQSGQDMAKDAAGAVAGAGADAFNALIPGAGTILEHGSDIRGGIKSGAEKAGSGIKHWWQRGFAEGGTGIKGGPAWVGEKGPEIMEVPDFGRKIVGQQGPEQVNVPEGANIIPLEEAMAFQQIQQAAQQPGGKNPQRQQQEAQARANDPNLEQKVRDSLKKAFASEAVTNPPFTPIIEDSRAKDYWAPWRQLTGTPAYAEEAMAMQEEAQKGQRGGGGQRQQGQQQRPAQPQGARR